jgi:prevent-host-death family protein
MAELMLTRNVPVKRQRPWAGLTKGLLSSKKRMDATALDSRRFEVHTTYRLLKGDVMKLSFLDLRKKPGKLLEALERRESVTISRRGKAIARVMPVEGQNGGTVADHPAFGMWADNSEMADVAETVRKMRKGRFDAI